MIVADANITAYLLIDSKYSQLARTLYEHDPGWLVPQIWPHEFVNVLATYAKTGGLAARECLDAWRDAIGIFNGRIMATDFEGAFKLAVEHGLSLYDAEYVYLSRAEGVPLVTEDKKIVNAFPKQAFSMMRYLETVK